MVSSLLERLYGLCFLLWGFPDFSVYPWCPFALVFSHSFDSKCLAAKRVGQQVLQCLHFAPLALLLSLDDTHLKPSHFLIDRLPMNGVPAHFVVGSCTSSLHFCRHLHCLLSRLLKFSRHERPDGSQPTFVWSLFHLLSIPLQNGARLLHLPLSAALSAFFAVCFPMRGGLRIFHVPLAYRKMVEVLSVRRWLIVCDGRKRSSQSSPRAFWLKPLSTFGLLVLTTFNDSSHVLTFPPES